jgi:hypothetical protein
MLRPPSLTAECTCSHWVDCDCGCHARHCDPLENQCAVEFLPDEGGLARWGCRACTPGQGLPHDFQCELVGWNVPVVRGARLMG